MKWTTKRIRAQFLEYFEERGHRIAPSAPIVIKDDPTLMFTNAGMNQFKGIFLGNEAIEDARVADSQKCLRVSGKHNDLEEVGRDHYHHTMFEMLGNWSFGDYFKKEAIEWAWDLLSNVYGLEKERLYVTIFEGDQDLGLDEDAEAREFWKDHIKEERILSFGKKDNFWEMGETGPCGPCSEIHYDMRSLEDRTASDASDLVNRDHPEVIEIWNLVFMQFNRKEDGRLIPLKNKHIDTGMGLERLARALQGVSSNYDIDLFQRLIRVLEVQSGKKYEGSDSDADVGMRVIADHVRAIGFCIADGQMPSHTGAGYVVRRVLRRAIRYGYSALSMNKPFIYHLIDELSAEMGENYPELKQQADLIRKVIQEEEKSFLSTLSKGLERISEYLSNNEGTIDGKFAFELYDTFGFPIDLTQLIGREHGVQVDMQGFQNELQLQKERSRSASKASFGDWDVLVEDAESHYVGYDQLETSTQIIKQRKAKIKGKDQFQVVLKETPFYAESGGQVGDRGALLVNGEQIKVLDTQKENNEIIHIIDKLPTNPTADVKCTVDASRREEIMKNHTSTHLLHHALRHQLGKHVEQRGSLVEPDRLRFDFSHFEKIDVSQLEDIEREVRQMIQDDFSLEEFRSVPISEAKEMGAIALFGEKYGDQVRVIKFGPSIELCGGTHVPKSSVIGGFKILSESSSASGIRRIEAISGEAYTEYVKGRLALLDQVEEAMEHPKDLLSSVQKMKLELKAAQKEIESYREKEKASVSKNLEHEAEVYGDIKLVVKEIGGIGSKMLKEIAHQATSAHQNLVVALGTAEGDKVSLVVACHRDLVEAKGIDANKIIRDVSKEIDGGGGGQAFLAMAGGKNAKGLQGALQHARKIILDQAG